MFLEIISGRYQQEIEEVGFKQTEKYIDFMERYSYSSLFPILYHFPRI